jgi:molecular chaperone DnaK
MVNEAEANKEADMKRKELVESKNQAEALLHQTKKSLEENKGVVSDDEEKAIIDAAAAVEEALKNDAISKDELDAKVKTLTETSHKLAEAMYKKEQGGCESGSCGTDTKKKKDDDIIDADVE